MKVVAVETILGLRLEIRNDNGDMLATVAVPDEDVSDIACAAVHRASRGYMRASLHEACGEVAAIKLTDMNHYVAKGVSA